MGRNGARLLLIPGCLLLFAGVVLLAALVAGLSVDGLGAVTGRIAVGGVVGTAVVIGGLALISKAGSVLGWTLRDVLRAIFSPDGGWGD